MSFWKLEMKLQKKHIWKLTKKKKKKKKERLNSVYIRSKRGK